MQIDIPLLGLSHNRYQKPEEHWKKQLLEWRADKKEPNEGIFTRGTELSLKHFLFIMRPLTSGKSSSLFGLKLFTLKITKLPSFSNMKVFSDSRDSHVGDRGNGALVK